MKKWTKELTLILFGVAGTIFFSEGPAKAQSIPAKDSNFIYDNPVVARLDSLATLTFFTNEKFTTDIRKLNKYNFPADSIPTYPDSVYRSRIEYLNVHSPFEFVYNDQVKTYIELFAYKKRGLVSRMLGLAELYFPLFEEQLDIHGIPLELKYLPVIESAMNPVARSRAGASGLWQFMLTTGKLYNLEISSYVDERLDPDRSTVVACQLLSDLYNVYHDWAIVLAAYNAGPGTINRAIRGAGLDSSQTVTYWKIRKYLPIETQNYVPAFIAINYVMNYAAEHNLYPVAPDYFHCDIDTIAIKQQVKLEQIASYLCIPAEQVQFLNPEYKKGIVPATAGKPYTIRLPRKYMGDFINNKDAICQYKSDQEIQAEKDLAQAASNTATADKKTTPKANNTQQTATNNAVKTQTQSSEKYVYHVVQKGDSLWSIASHYKGASVDSIRRLNNLSKSAVLRPGMKLKVGVSG